MHPPLHLPTFLYPQFSLSSSHHCLSFPPCLCGSGAHSVSLITLFSSLPVSLRSFSFLHPIFLSTHSHSLLDICPFIHLSHPVSFTSPSPRSAGFTPHLCCRPFYELALSCPRSLHRPLLILLPCHSPPPSVSCSDPSGINAGG